MKVHIGKYRTWVGPYQIADLLQRVGVSEDRCHEIGKWLAETWVTDFCQWIEDKKHRKVEIVIDDYDVWSMDSTLAYIVLPMLKKLQGVKHGSPFTDDEDVPEHLRSTAAPPKEHEWDTDDLFHARWDYILAEMIWTFEQIHPDAEDSERFDMDKRQVKEERINNGTRLFGKYFRALWD